MAILYHGTNRLFDKFDKSKILSGEGHNTWGEGFYFAFNKKVSLEYAKATSKRYLVSPDGEMFDMSHSYDLATVDECVAYILKTLSDTKISGEEYDEKQVIKDVVDFSCFSTKSNLLHSHRLQEVTSRYNQVKNWKRNSGFLYTVEIDNEFIEKNSLLTKLYKGRQDGLCLIVTEPSIIKIVDVEVIPSVA